MEQDSKRTIPRALGVKRPAEGDIEVERVDPRGGLSDPLMARAREVDGQALSSNVPPTSVLPELSAADRETLVIMKEARAPLQQVQALAAEDRLNPDAAQVQDHGSWDGRWQLPTRSQWEVKGALRMKWPCGKDEYEAQAVQAARKEVSLVKDDRRRKGRVQEGVCSWLERLG